MIEIGGAKGITLKNPHEALDKIILMKTLFNLIIFKYSIKCLKKSNTLTLFEGPFEITFY
jgi:hypothetical protein